MLDREIEGGRPKPTTETQMLNAADEAAEQPHTAAVQLDQPPDLTAGEDEHNQLAGPGQPDQPVEAEVEEETTKIITREHAAPLLTQLEPAILGKLLEHLRADNLISREKNRRHHLSLPPPVVLSVAVPVPVTVDGHRQKREDEEDASAPTTTLAAAAAAGGLGEGGGGEAAAATFPPLPADPSATTSGIL
jgi:hypothetical protein